MSDQQQDTEIILGTGKLLGIFFGLVAICGTFFGLGYSIGRSSSGGPITLQDGQSVTVAKGPVNKPAAGVTVTAAPAAITETPQTPIPDPNAAANTQPQQMSATQDPAANASASSDNTTANTTIPPSLTQVAAKSTAADPNAAATITVQVAAVTKEEDAQALVTALRRKNYPVFVPPNPSADSLYHVQVGPFAELKDAEAMKSKLEGDGYNAIVKK